MALTVRFQEPLADRVTLRSGGPAEAWVSVATEHDIDEAVGYAQERQWPLTILGSGSNVLVPDEGVPGLVIHLANKGIEATCEGDAVFLTAQAGDRFDDVVAYAVEHEWWGLENLSHIPGTVGAAPVQNVGAYGVEVSQLIHTVRVYDTYDRVFKMFTNKECDFGYRDSFFKHQPRARYIIVAVTFKLSTQSTPQLSYHDLAEQFGSATTPNIAVVRDAVIAIRAQKFPDWQQVGTAGSFFKNPAITLAAYDTLLVKYPGLPSYVADELHVKVSLGWVLDKILSLKGLCAGPVCLSATQALVLINKGGATSKDIEIFANDIGARVYDATGITVEWEVRRL